MALFVRRVIYNYCIADEDSHSRELQEGTLDQNEYERRYADLTERYNTIKADYDKISEQIESKKAQRELFKGFIRALEKQGALVEEFDEGLWSSLVQEVVVKSKNDILWKVFFLPCPELRYFDSKCWIGISASLFLVHVTSCLVKK